MDLPAAASGSMEPDYRLRDGVFACEAGGAVVLLDWREDRYVAYAEDDSLGPDIIAGWPPRKKNSHSSSAPAGDTCREALDSLRDERLVVPFSPFLGDPIRVAAPPVLTSLLGEVAPPFRPPRIGDLARVTIAYSRVRFSLVRRSGLPFRQTSNSKGKRKNPGKREETATFDTLLDMVGRFNALRIFFVGRAGGCLTESLTLAHFLRAHGIETHCVVGVRMHPFQAHCWTQYRGTALNERFKVARSYVPIACL